MIDSTERATLEEVALAHRYRRWLFYCLFTYANPMRLPDIAHQLAVWDQQDEASDLFENRLAIYDTLYHDHLPVLGEVGLVTYHQSGDKVELGSDASQIESPITERSASEIDTLLAAEGRDIQPSDAVE